MTKAPVVKTAELNPKCEGCMAASRIIGIQNRSRAIALKKIRELSKELEDLKKKYEILLKQER